MVVRAVEFCVTPHQLVVLAVCGTKEEDPQAGPGLLVLDMRTGNGEVDVTGGRLLRWQRIVSDSEIQKPGM